MDKLGSAGQSTVAQPIFQYASVCHLLPGREDEVSQSSHHQTVPAEIAESLSNQLACGLEDEIKDGATNQKGL
jgi:hypothetical protein